MSIITFFTVCGGEEEYEFLLGSIEHHAAIGRHIVLDVSPDPKAFLGIPKSVEWHHAPPDGYGSGDWKTFRLATALEDARRMALDRFPDTEFLVHLDCDEYFDGDVLRTLFRRQESAGVGDPSIFVFETIHWRGGQALRFGASEWHMRAWDIRADVRVIRNLSWIASSSYNGNPEHHPLLSPQVEKVQEVRVGQPAHYHLHYALGKKRFFEETAITTIEGWPVGTPIKNACPWPDPFLRWAAAGQLPSRRYSE